MGNFLQFFIVIILLLAVLISQWFPVAEKLLKQHPAEKIPSLTPKSSAVYTFTFKGDIKLAKELLQRGFYVSYSDGKIFLSVPNREKAVEVLDLYGNYTKNYSQRVEAAYAVSKLIGEDIKRTREELKKTQEDFEELKRILTARGIDVDFSPFGKKVLDLQREVFEETTSYWDRKYQQILSGYKIAVHTPRVDINPLLERARNYLNDELKLRLFKLWVKGKILESRLTADLVKYREYGSAR